MIDFGFYFVNVQRIAMRRMGHHTMLISIFNVGFNVQIFLSFQFFFKFNFECLNFNSKYYVLNFFYFFLLLNVYLKSFFAFI